MWPSRRAATPWCEHFSTVISPTWITEQITVGKYAHRGTSVRRERQTSFKIVTWTKQTKDKKSQQPSSGTYWLFMLSYSNAKWTTRSIKATLGSRYRILDLAYISNLEGMPDPNKTPSDRLPGIGNTGELISNLNNSATIKSQKIKISLGHL